jgi:hypothetical protein
VARRKKPGDLKQLQAILWEGMEALEKFCKAAVDAKDSQELRSIMHCLTQSAGVYTRLVEVGQLEERVAALEANQERGNT